MRSVRGIPFLPAEAVVDALLEELSESPLESGEGDTSPDTENGQQAATPRAKTLAITPDVSDPVSWTVVYVC